MKTLLILFALLWTLGAQSQPVFSENGHPEHFITGTLISGGISYFVFTKTNNKVKAWIIGATTSSLIGYLKEVVDPKWFGGVRSSKDFMYSALGSLLGASIVIPLGNRPKSRKLKKVKKLF